MIVKLQWPLMTNEDTPKVLAYNKIRSFNAQIPITPELKQLFGVKLKIYVEANLINGELQIVERVKDQDW